MSPKLPKLLTNKFVVVGIVAAVLIVLLLAFLYIDVISTIAKLTPTPSVVGQVSLNGGVVGSGVATYDYGSSLVAYATLNYTAVNSTKVNVSLSAYSKDPLFHIYFVNSGAACSSCFDESSLYSSLSTSLGNAGLLQNGTTLQNVNLYDLNQTADNSVIILSTGLLPASLLLYTGVPSTPGEANVTLRSLLKKGDYIIYVGGNFSEILSQNGQTYLTPIQALENLSESGITTFSYTNVSTNSGLNYTTPQYAFYGGRVHDAIAYINVTNGTIMAFSNLPTKIWENVSFEANDLTKAIASRFWIHLLTQGNYSFNLTGTSPTSGDVNIFSTNITLNNSRTAPQQIDSSYGLIRVHAYNQESYADKEFPLSLTLNPNGTLETPATIGYGNLVQVQTKVNTLSSRIAFSINLYNRSDAFVNANSIGFFNTSLPIISRYSFGNVKVGNYYLAKLVNINDKQFGDAVFYVPYLIINATYVNFKNATFVFSVESDGQSLSGPEYQISLDGANNESGTVQNGEIKYALPQGTIINYGYQTLRISIGNNVYSIPGYYSAPASIPPLYIEFGAAALVIVLLNFILRAPNVEEYYIDVSSLPPTKKVEVTLSGDTIVNLFDTINYHFHWRYMPLTSEEIKSGISSNVRFGNTPISITLQNTNEVLYKLAGDGKLAYSEEYYVPTKWLETSKHDIEYLIIFRKMRDFFVEHAIFFTDLDASAEADTIITVKNKQISVFIYSRASGMRSAPLHKGGKSFIVMISGEARQDLQDKLYNTYGKKSSTLRLAIESNSLEIIDVEHLDALLY